MSINDLPLSATVDANGNAHMELRTWAGAAWSITQVSTEMTDAPGGTSGAPAGSTSALRKNGALITTLIASGDVASGDPAVPLAGGDVLTIDWAGCAPGAVAQALIMYDDGL